DLENEVPSSFQGEIPAHFRIEARVSYQGEVVKGIAFRIPSVKLKDQSVRVRIDGLYLYLDDKKQRGVTTFSGVSHVAGSAEYAPMSNYEYVAYAAYPSLTANTQISFEFDQIQKTSQSPTDLPDPNT